jgi:sugar lactone lactonase YvrE
MNPLLSAMTRYIRRSRLDRGRLRTGRRNPRRRLCLELLEDRTVPTTISVANASLNEIGTPSAFVAAGSGGLASPGGITLGPDGNLYVASNGGAVLRYNATTGAFINTFVSQGSGGLSGLAGNCLAFGPDGNLYVSSANTNQVLEYNGGTGAFVQAFVAAGSGGLTDPRGLTFGPDGNLYVTSFNVSTGVNGIMRYDGPLTASPGSPLPAAGLSGATFVPQYEAMPPEPGGVPVGGPGHLIFGPDGSLYVDGGFFQGVNRYDATTGAFLNTFIAQGTGGLASGGSMDFDQEGRFYVASGGNVLRYDSQGNFLDDLLVNSTNPNKPAGMIFDTQGNLLFSSNNAVWRYGGLTVSLDAPSSTSVSVSYTTADGSASAGKDYFALSGTVTFAPGQTARTILLATQEEAVLDGNETFGVQLTNPAGGATIGTGTATVTIVDPTRRFSVGNTSGIEGDQTAHYRGAFVSGITGNGFNMLTFGPDGNLYTENSGIPGLNPNAVGRFNGTTGAFMGQFTPSGYIEGVRDMVFHGGYLYVASEYNNEVLQFNGTTGAFVSVFVTPGSGGFSGPHGLTFGPDGNLYVSGRNNAVVVRYNGTTGAPIGTYVTSGSGGMSLPEGIAFDPSGQYLYVASTGSSQVLKYNAQTGAFVGVAASDGVSAPKDVLFGSDGLMYVLSSGNNRILRFTTGGTYVDDYVPAGSGGMANIHRMAFGPDGDLYVAALNPTPAQIMRFGTENEEVFTVTNTTASSLPLTVNYATTDGTAVSTGTHPNYLASSGTITFAPGVTSATIDVPLLDSGSQTTPLTFTLTLSNPQAATLGQSQGTATIAPSDQKAKFYVVNGATSSIGGTNAAFKYQPSGTEQAPYGLSVTTASPDLSPMGIASNASGTTQWVVDANKNVYVYSSSGTLLGSWAALGIPSSAQVTGIATNGTDIWLLDPGSTSTVYKYAGAASLLSGSQNPASSFNLANSKKNNNSNPQDIVTDGTSFWVVDGTALKVFKYTLSGSLLGSWAIDPANTHPTGITIDPTNVSDIWIVDNGTDKVYQYVGAAGRTSGSQNAAATFALNPYDTNPQGIADPPVPGMDSVIAPAAGSVTATNAPSPTDASADGTADWSWLAEGTRSADLGCVQAGENRHSNSPAGKPPEATGSGEWKPASYAATSTAFWGSSTDALAARDLIFAGDLDSYGSELAPVLADARS